MTRKSRRLYFVLLALLGLGAGVALVLTAFNDNIVFFFSPTEVAEKHPNPDQRLRVGGLVVDGSVKKNGATVVFSVTDMSNVLPIVYTGVLPDLFREGQGIVAEGHMGANGMFAASEVLAKHDEKYMPKEVADALKKNGRWQEGSEANPAPAAPATSQP